MMNAIESRCLSFRTERDPQGRQVIRVSEDAGKSYAETRFCGETRCQGDCGHPALVLTLEDREYKCHSSAVAVGPVFSGWRVPAWHGQKVAVTVCDPLELIKRMWW